MTASLQPVIEIDNRAWPTPPPPPPPPKRANGLLPISLNNENTSRKSSSSSSSNSSNCNNRSSSSPIFVSASHVSIPSTSSSQPQQAKRPQTIVEVDLSQEATQKRANLKARQRRDHEYVWPPYTVDTRIASIFDKHHGPSLWCPSHRIAKSPEEVACQWIINDEGFGDLERCGKVFLTVEALAKHVCFSHCIRQPRPASHAMPMGELLPCLWGHCKFKRFAAPRLKQHLLEHLAPMAYSCPYEHCHMSTKMHSDSSEDLDVHIQTYHVNEDVLRPLGIPRSVKALFPKPPPALPGSVPQYQLNNPQIDTAQEQTKKTALEPLQTAPTRPGEVLPWDQLWLELNKLEPPAIAIDTAVDIVTPFDEASLPTIDIDPVLPAMALSQEPSVGLTVEVLIDTLPVVHHPPHHTLDYIDLTEDNIPLYPRKPDAKYPPVPDMTAASLARRDAIRAHHRERIRSVPPAAGNANSAANLQSHFLGRVLSRNRQMQEDESDDDIDDDDDESLANTHDRKRPRLSPDEL